MIEQPDLTPPAGVDFGRRLIAALAWTGAGLGVGYAVRFLAIEPEVIGRACLADAAPWGCGLRQGLISLFHHGVLGGAAVAAGLVAVFGRRGRRLFLRAALVAGGLALALYNAGLGSVAVVLGLLAATAPGGAKAKAKQEATRSASTGAPDG